MVSLCDKTNSVKIDSLKHLCCEAVLLHYIVNVYFQCLQCYTLPVITFCLSLLNAIAGYFVFR